MVQAGLSLVQILFMGAEGEVLGETAVQRELVFLVGTVALVVHREMERRAPYPAVAVAELNLAQLAAQVAVAVASFGGSHEHNLRNY